jgi:hypothetical protein
MPCQSVREGASHSEAKAAGHASAGSGGEYTEILARVVRRWLSPRCAMRDTAARRTCAKYSRPKLITPSVYYRVTTRQLCANVALGQLLILGLYSLAQWTVHSSPVIPLGRRCRRPPTAPGADVA